jgi:hypothetical protein
MRSSTCEEQQNDQKEKINIPLMECSGVQGVGYTISGMCRDVRMPDIVPPGMPRRTGTGIAAPGRERTVNSTEEMSIHARLSKNNP